MVHVLGVVSECEREATAERTRDALAQLRAEGVRRGGEPLGWRRCEARDENGRGAGEDVANELAVVDRVVALREEGLSLRAIARVLSAEDRPHQARRTLAFHHHSAHPRPPPS